MDRYREFGLATAAFREVIKQVELVGLIDEFRQLDLWMLASEVVALVDMTDRAGAPAYHNAAVFLRRYGTLAGDKRLHVAAAVLDAAAQLLKTHSEKGAIGKEVE